MSRIFARDSLRAFLSLSLEYKAFFSSNAPTLASLENGLRACPEPVPDLPSVGVGMLGQHLQQLLLVELASALAALRWQHLPGLGPQFEPFIYGPSAHPEDLAHFHLRMARIEIGQHPPLQLHAVSVSHPSLLLYYVLL